MISIIIKLSIRFSLVDLFLSKLLFAYTQSKGTDQLAKERVKKLAENLALKDLKRITAYETMGIGEKPITIKAGR